MLITNLAVELLSQICSYLELSDWQALRLSCPALYANSLEAFSDRYFKSIRFMVTSDSLLELEEISRSDTFRDRVEELWMIPNA
ncbi:hypothetical protein N7457_001478 [Penicillium paradoxum]|uniref:uncharacterized protein n=1 Tax=Penicillium paradoxum TaxID=176176 RepID=UPI0025495CAF|nr:uncharacterized protein N7457_001478 [Penicillium paradoxum]KAJ5794879.1 hypothetical protein N7457_001478 [Penicillium paradoxum]